MTSLRDQFSAVRKAQFDAQFDFFNAIATQTLESASRVAALNLSVSRDAVERSIGAGFTLMNSRDPRDVLALGGQAEAQVRSLFAYSRELLGIASGMRPYAVRPQALGLASRQAIETVEVIERGVAQASAQVEQAAAAPVETPAAAAPAVESIADTVAQAAAEAVPAADAAASGDASPATDAPHPVAAFAPVTEPVVVAEAPAAPEALAAAAEPVPVAEPKAIAKAVGKGSARAAAAPHPAAAPLPEEGEAVAKIELPQASSRRKK